MRKATTLMALMIALIALGAATTQTWSLDSTTDFEQGTFLNTTANNSVVQLNTTTYNVTVTGPEGNMTNESRTRYLEHGNYTTIWHDWGNTANLTGFSVNDTVPENTSLSFQLRSSSDGTDSTASAWYSSYTNVPDDQFVQVRAVFSTTNNTTTPSVDGLTVTANVNDGSAPEVTFTDRPQGQTADQTPHYAGETDERATIEYRVDGGSWQALCTNCQTFAFNTSTLSGGEHTVEVRATDFWGNTGTASDQVTIADGSEFTFHPAYTTTYPASALPVDPDSSFWEEDTDVDFNFTLVGPETFDISNRYAGGICDLRGLEEWPIPDENDYYCGTEVPSSAALGDYNLKVEWRLQGQYHSGFVGPNGDIVSQSNAQTIQVKKIGDWVTQTSSHGGHLQDSSSISHGINVDKDTSSESGTIYTCPGATLTVNNIGQVQVQCTNGATGGEEAPGVVGFISRSGTEIATANNNMFGGGCSIDTTRAVLRGRVLQGGTNRSSTGYNPGCNLGWQMSGSSGSFDVYTFSETGSYSVQLDYINAISDSPDFICPASATNSQCDVGSMSGDQQGWIALDQYNIEVVDPELTGQGLSLSNAINTTVSGTKWVRRADYDESMTVTWTLKNTGIGDVAINDISITCPSNMTCTKPSVTTISEGGTTQLVFSLDSPDGDRGFGQYRIELTYSDNHGLSCIGQHTLTKTFQVDERGPTADVTGMSAPSQWYNATDPDQLWFTEEPVDISMSSSDNGGVGVDTVEWCTDQSDSCTPDQALPASVNGGEGLNYVRYQAVDLLGNVGPTGSTDLLIDTQPPEVSCQDCVQPEVAETGEQIRMSPEVTDAGIGVSSVSICGDQACSQVFCTLGQSGNCTYSSAERTSSEVWVRSRDLLGRLTTTQIGSFEVLLPDGAFCTADNQCLSGQCSENTCQPNRVPPEVIIR